MTTRARRSTRTAARNATRKLVITLGELISAAYDAVPDERKLDGALKLLTRSPLARHIHPHVEFVR